MSVFCGFLTTLDLIWSTAEPTAATAREHFFIEKLGRLHFFCGAFRNKFFSLFEATGSCHDRRKKSQEGERAGDPLALPAALRFQHNSSETPPPPFLLGGMLDDHFCFQPGGGERASPGRPAND